MKLMIASDIHGAAGFCRALLAACAAEAPDRLLLLGDILYHGPRNDLPEGYDPKQVIALLNPLRDQLLCVRGNCDTEVDQMVLDFPILSDSCAVWAGARAILPPTATAGTCKARRRLPPGISCCTATPMCPRGSPSGGTTGT